MAVGEAGLVRSSGFVESEGERIYYEVTGSGEPVVFCHGLGGNHAIWWQQIESFAAKSTVVTWDQRGFGNSTCSSGDFGPAPARRDLAALLRELEIDSAHLVGQSMGGWVTLGFAVAHPAQTRSLVLSTTLAGAPKQQAEDALVSGEPERARDNRREHPVLSRTFCDANPDLGVLYNQISSFGQQLSPGDVLQRMADDQFPLTALRSVSAPTLLVAATEDPFCRLRVMASVAASIPGSRLVEIAGGHSAYYERPAEWNRVVLDFLAAQR